jgi:hypothetical protein
MQLSHLRAALAAGAFALAACAGNVVSSPSSGLSAMTPLTATVAKKTGGACSTLSDTWDFQGACKGMNLKAAGGEVELQRYNGVAVHLAFHKSDTTGAVPFLFGDANGTGDIAGTFDGAPFPVYGASCVNASLRATTCNGTAFVYVEAVNTTQTKVDLTSSPRIVVTSHKPFPGTACTMAVLQTSGAWMITSLTATAKKHVLTFQPAAFPMSLPPGGFYITIACA